MNPQIHPNPPIVHKHILHLKIRLLRILPLIKLNERVLQTIPRSLVPDDLARHDRAEAREDELKVLVPRHRVEFAHEEDVLGRSDVGEGKVSDHFEREGCCAGGLSSALSFFLFFRELS